jgi:membrane fusion protein, multidrug efflux system
MNTHMTRKYRHFIVGAVLSVAVGVAVGFTVYRLAHTVQADARMVHLPIPVQTVSATVKLLHDTIGASGVIQPSMPVTLTAKVVSRVSKVRVDLGAVVRPGQILVQMDRRLFEANLETARDAYDHAHKQFLRMQALMKRNFASAVDVEKARTDEAAARDAMVRAELDLANTTIASPVTAVVLGRDVNPGEITQLDQNLIELGVIDPVMMVAQVSEDKLGSVYVGMKSETATDAFPGLTFTGTVEKTDFRINDSTRTFGVYIRLANHDLRLTKGVTGYSRLESERMALAVPTTAVMNPVGDHATVFVVTKDSIAHLRRVQRGLMVEGQVEVLGGLREGERVVTVGQFGLRDNEIVSADHFAPWNKGSPNQVSRSANVKGQAPHSANKQAERAQPQKEKVTKASDLDAFDMDAFGAQFNAVAFGTPPLVQGIIPSMASDSSPDATAPTLRSTDR